MWAVIFSYFAVPARYQFKVLFYGIFGAIVLRAVFIFASKFRYLNVGLGVILGFVGIKMMLVEVIHLPTWLSLGVITCVLTATIVASLRAEQRHPSLVPTAAEPGPPPSDR